MSADTGTGTSGAHGYHAVWTRDEYEMATALLAAGDSADALAALNYIFGYEVESNGAVKQNTWLNGTAVFGSLQMDEVADPIILAYQLGATGSSDWAYVKELAGYLLANGPYTPEERWEENGGYSPSTMTAEIAGLLCAASIAEANGDSADAASYQSTAQSWASEVDTLTYTTTGPYGHGAYFLRITPDDTAASGMLSQSQLMVSLRGTVSCDASQAARRISGVPVSSLCDGHECIADGAVAPCFHTAISRRAGSGRRWPADSGRVDHGDRAGSVRQQRGRYRTQGHPGEAAPAAVAHHEQLGVLGGGQHGVPRRGAGDLPVQFDVRVLLLPGDDRSLEVLRDEGCSGQIPGSVRQRAHGRQRHPVQRSLGAGEAQRGFCRRRAIDSHDDMPGNIAAGRAPVPAHDDHGDRCARRHLQADRSQQEPRQAFEATGTDDQHVGVGALLA